MMVQNQLKFYKDFYDENQKAIQEEEDQDLVD